MVSFRCYDPSGDNSGGIHQWLNSLPASYRAQIVSVLEILSSDPEWDEDDAKPLRGACEGLTEIIVDFFIDKKTEIYIRILGVHGPGHDEFTLLTGFEKSNDNAIYGYYCIQAFERLNGANRDGRRVPACDFF